MASRPPRWSSEKQLIAELFEPLTAGSPVARGLADDAAVLPQVPDTDLVITTDGLIEGVHFLPSASAADVGWKALAVNVSDLVAKGATPGSYLMNITLNDTCDVSWLEGYVQGLAEAQTAFGCTLIGGDTDRSEGPLSITITALGRVPTGRAPLRSGASAGDRLYVMGRVGDAHLGLRLTRGDNEAEHWPLSQAERTHLIAQFNRPVPHVCAAPLVINYARASIDISDGLATDVAHLAAASGLGADLNAEAIPLSQPAQHLVRSGAILLADLIGGGEDYVVLVAVGPTDTDEFEQSAAEQGIAAISIGLMSDRHADVIFKHQNGTVIAIESTGWDHLRTP